MSGCILSVRQSFLSLLTLAYFALAGVLVMPEGADRDRLLGVFGGVSSSIGLKQRWNLFAPDIRRMTQYSSALITFADGSVRICEWPRVDRSGPLDRFLYQRLRRFLTECWEIPDYEHFRPYGASYLAESHYEKENPPVRVELIFNGKEIPPMSRYVKQMDFPSSYEPFTTFVYTPAKPHAEPDVVPSGGGARP